MCCQTNICFQATLKEIEHKYKCDFTKNESLKMSPLVRLRTENGLFARYDPQLFHSLSLNNSLCINSSVAATIKDRSTNTSSSSFGTMDSVPCTVVQEGTANLKG